MEEADAFIKEACKQIDCSFADDNDIEFSTPQIFEFLVRCIWKIDLNSKKVIPSYVYPNVITSRLHLGNAISNYLQKFHIRGDTALHTVLYGNINNLRSAFIELIRKLPIDTSEITSQDLCQQFFENIVQSLDSKPEYVPAYCRGLKDKKGWILPDNQPEFLPLSHFDKLSEHIDPRQWISQYINSSHLDRNVNERSRKPVLPPKPVFSEEQKNTGEEPVGEQVEVTQKTDETILTEEDYIAKLDVLYKEQEKRFILQRENKEYEKYLAEFDHELIEAYADPDAYVAKLANKIMDLNKQMEEDTLKLENRKEEAAKTKLAIAEEMKKLGTDDEEWKNVEEMEAALKGFDAEIEENEQLANKLRKKLARFDKSQEKSVYDYEKRSKELDEMVRKQETDMLQRQEERDVLWKQEEKDSEAVNRSFALIYNILLQHCDHYRGRLAMESFTRIHLYCMEILEMLKDNGALKQAVGLLQSDIYVEEDKQYGKQFELLNRDYQEMLNLNNQLLSEIKLQKPDFKLPVV